MQSKFDVIAFTFDMIEHRCDVSGNELGRYSANAGTLEQKIDKQFEGLDVIAICKVMTRATPLRMRRGLTCEDIITSNLRQSREAPNPHTLNFARISSAPVNNHALHSRRSASTRRAA